MARHWLRARNWWGDRLCRLSRATRHSAQHSSTQRLHCKALAPHWLRLPHLQPRVHTARLLVDHLVRKASRLHCKEGHEGSAAMTNRGLEDSSTGGNRREEQDRMCREPPPLCPLLAPAASAAGPSAHQRWEGCCHHRPVPAHHVGDDVVGPVHPGRIVGHVHCIRLEVRHLEGGGREDIAGSGVG